MKADQGPTAYALLGVQRHASALEVVAAFRKKAATAHPDKGGSVSEFTALTNARDVLIDREKRRLYDDFMQTNYDPCVKCDGTGRRREQKGFKFVDMGQCTLCMGVGYK